MLFKMFTSPSFLNMCLYLVANFREVNQFECSRPSVDSTGFSFAKESLHFKPQNVDNPRTQIEVRKNGKPLPSRPPKV